MKPKYEKYRKHADIPINRVTSLLVIVLNIVLLLSAVLVYGHYSGVYKERLRQENLGNIATLNRSAAGSATALIDSWNLKLDDLEKYIELHHLSLDETLEFLEQANSSSDRQFELIGRDYTGYLARRGDDGGFIPLSYSSGAYKDLQCTIDDVEGDANKDICFAPEFTDQETALKYFATYRHITLYGNDGEPEIFTLLLASKASSVLAAFNGQLDFEGQSTVPIKASGSYIVSSSNFKSANFFQYLYVYNDLSMDQRNAIGQEMTENGTGELYYKNAAGEDCVFVYSKMSTSDWYCVTCVPMDSFRTTVFNISYTVYVSVILLFLMVIDVMWLRMLNKRLLVSMLHEKEASSAKTDFLSRMSHDIRTPLNGIIGLTYLASDEPNPPRTAEYLDNIRVSGQFLMGLVNDILDMSKVESGKVELHPEPYSGEDLCKYVEAVMAPLCRDKGQEFRVTPSSGGSPVLLDRLRFNQIVFNLLSNAVKYTPSGGLVELFWLRNDLENGRVALDVTVRDNGIGMSEEYQKHMFDAFSQERSQASSSGSGLGLAIVNSLVKLMNGRISVVSRQGEGTAVTVHVETDACDEIRETPAEIKAVTLAGRHALVCEDNPINSLFIRRLLEKWSITADCVVNGKLGVDKFTSSAAGAYDIILMDVMMPEMSGLEATKAIRRSSHPDAAVIPIIAMTANAYDTDVKNCIDAGMNAHMGKPIDPDRLRELVAQAISGAL